MEEKKEEKKIIIINGKEFETYSPLTSDILKCVSYANKVSEMDSLGLIEKYLTFIIKWWWFIIIFMIFALFTNGGVECDIVIGIVLVVSIIWGKYYSECSAIYIQFNFLGASSYSWDSFEAANNTLKEAKYLIPKLKECEKQTDEIIRWKMYLELVKEMDEKYGDRKHMLGRPYTKEENKKDKEVKVTDEIIKEARECAVKDVIAFLNKANELFADFKNDIDSFTSWFNLESFLRSRHNDLSMTYFYKTRFEVKNASLTKQRNLFYETYANIYDQIIGEPIAGYHKKDTWGICELIYLYANKIHKGERDFIDCYSEYDDGYLEGKKVYEIQQLINRIPEIKEVYNKINILPNVTDEEYENFCYFIETYNYTFDSIREELR